MNSVIFNPLEEYETRLRALHSEKTNAFLENLTKEAGVDIEENRRTVKEYETHKEHLSDLQKKLKWLKFLRVIMCITIVLIPLVIMKTTPKIKALTEDIEQADKKVEELLALAYKQMAPLNGRFTDRDALSIIESVIPLISFAPHFSSKQELDMRTNYDFRDYGGTDQSTLDVLAGTYNENPFLFENKFIHTMGTQVYHGYKTIYWTETVRDSDGNLQTVTRSQTLHATVTKPKPFYSTQVVLHYGSQGGPELSFSRDATHLDQKSDKAIERYVKRGERKLKRMTDKAISTNDDFVSMANTDFEVLFDALDRTNEVQFRTLFTPLAQTNMVDLIRSQTGYGDDFNFIKVNRMNKIISNHSQGRAINILAFHYKSYSYDIIKANFLSKNTDFFKAVYFDFAPLLAIPIYQERPVHSLKPIPDYAQKYSQKECEALVNTVNRAYVVHPETKTSAILKSAFVAADGGKEKIAVTAYSYDIIQRIAIIPMWGGDGRLHDVEVLWDDYIPLTARNEFFVADAATSAAQQKISTHNGLCIFK